jgi:uncharacterized protein YunC (DUF1805 family)
MEKIKKFIADWQAKSRLLRQAKRETEMKVLYNITMKGDEVYLVCGNMAVHLFSQNDKIADVIAKVKAVRTTAVKYSNDNG